MSEVLVLGVPDENGGESCGLPPHGKSPRNGGPPALTKLLIARPCPARSTWLPCRDFDVTYRDDSRPADSRPRWQDALRDLYGCCPPWAIGLFRPMSSGKGGWPRVKLLANFGV